VLDGALVGTRSTAGISVVMKVRLVRLEMLEGRLSVDTKDDDHKGAHQIGRVGDLGEVGTLRVVIDTGRALE